MGSNSVKEPVNNTTLKWNELSEKKKEMEYYKSIRDNVPNIEELDDEEVTPDFFEKKISECDAAAPPAKKADVIDLSVAKKFMSFGLSENIL